MLSFIMVISLLVNTGYYSTAAANVVTLDRTSVELYTFVNGNQTVIQDGDVLKNGDNIKLIFNWSVANTEGNSITNETDLQYNLGCSGVAISNSQGSVLQNGINVGTYSIDPNGLLHMTITDSTLLSQSNIKGGLEIDAVIQAAGDNENEYGQEDVKIAGETITVQVTNPETLPSVSKARAGEVYMEGNNYYQNFTVTVTDNSNASSITLTDTFGAYLSYVDGSLTLDGNPVAGTSSNGTLTHTIDNPVKGQQYVYTYKALVSKEAFKDNYWYSSNDRAMYNTATVTNSNNKSATSDVFALGYKNWASKWGSYDASTDTIFWCITVNEGDAIKVAGTKIIDTLPAGTEITGNVIVKDPNGNPVADISGDKLTGGYTIGDYITQGNPTGKYTIEYRTKATNSNAGLATKAYTNTVKVTNENYGVDKEVKATVTVKNDWLTKRYTTVDPVAETITWQVIITIPQSQAEGEDITFTDTFGTGLEYVPGTYSATYNGSDITGSDITVNNGVFTVNFAGLKYQDGKDNKVVIEYTTKYTVEDGVTQQDFMNTALITDESGNTEEDKSTYRYTPSDINIVPYKWHTGSNGTASSWGIQVNGANKLYDDVIAGKKVYIYDTPSLTTTGGTAIDAGFNVVPGSIKVGSNATDLITATTAADGKTIVFDITEYIRNNQHNCYYFELYYTVALDASTVKDMMAQDINQANMANTVNAYLYSSDGTQKEEDLGSTVANGVGTPSIGALLTKSYTYDATTAPYANYIIDINPQAIDLVDGNGTLSLEDKMGKDLQIDISTVKLIDVKTGNTIVGTTSAFNSTTNTLVINNIPDATHCKLTYTVRVNVEYSASNPTFESLGDSVDVSNACSLFANTDTYSSSQTKITGNIQKSSAWAQSEYGSIILSKHNGLTALGNAEFTLTAYKLDDNGNFVVNNNYATEYANKGVTIGTIDNPIKTDSNGKKTVNLLFDILYCIEESKAPEGYVGVGQKMYVIIPGNDYNEVQASGVTVADAVSSFEAANGVTVNELTNGSSYYVENEELSQYSIQIVKDDQYSNYVEGATFELLVNDGNGNYVQATDYNGNKIPAATTDSYGRITFNNLVAGEYRINETVVPAGYKVTSSSTQDFTLNEQDKTATIYVENTKLYGEWTITKYQTSTTKVLPGVVFGIYKEGDDTTPIATATTNASGQVTFDKLELDTKYTVREISTIDGYILSNRAIEFTPSGDTDATLKKQDDFYNDKEAGTIKITKTEEGNSSNPVKDAVYTLYDTDKNIVYKTVDDGNGGTKEVPVTAKTDANGIATFTDLEFGHYLVRETEAPTNYELDNDYYPVEVNSNTMPATMAHTNKLVPVIDPYMSFKFKKEGYTEAGVSTGPLAGATFELFRFDTGGNKVSAGYAVSDADGYVYFMNVTRSEKDASNNDVYYTYNIREVSAPAGYKMESFNSISINAEAMERYKHPTEYQLTDKDSVLTLTDNYTESGTEVVIDNYKTVGKVVLKKTDEYGTTALPYARYAAYKDGSTTPSAVAMSGTDGLLEFTGLEYGATYVFKEIQAPDGYTISDQEFTVTIGVTEGYVVEPYNVTVDNAGIDNVFVYKDLDANPDKKYTAMDSPIKLNISKQNITGSSEVHGASLKLTDSQGKVVDSWTSTTTPHSIDNDKIKINTIYTLTETAAPDGYAYSEEITFKIGANGDIEILAGSDSDATVNNTTHTVVMKDAAVGFKLAKVDKSTGDRLTGATLQLLKADGNTVLKEWTSASGSDYTIDSAVAENIGIKVPASKGEYTEYIYREKNAPSGYYKAADIHFYLGYTGQVYMKNDAGTYVAVEDNRIIMQDIAFSDDVIISKVAIAGGPELPGASLTIVDKSNNDAVVDTWVSTANAHTIDISKFVNGHTYELIETGAPAGYAYAESMEFTINDNGKVEIGGQLQDGNIVTMVDNALSVTVKKTDGDNNPLDGAEITLEHITDGQIFVIRDGEQGEDIGKYLEAGKVDSNGIETLNQYKLSETKVPFGYKRADDIYFALDSEGNVHLSTDLGQTYSKAPSNVITMKDEYETVAISKYDVTNSKEIDGASLRIVKADDKSSVASWTSNAAKGPEKLNVADYFQPNVIYELTETMAPYGYEIAESIEFYFDDNTALYVKLAGETTFTAKNDDTIVMVDGLSDIHFSKKDATNAAELPGAHLVITNSAGSVVDEWDSTTEKHTLKLLGNFVSMAEYTLTETIAPYGYEIAESIVFRITKEGVIQIKDGNVFKDVTDDTVVMTDEIKHVYFSKVDATNSAEITGAILTVKDGNNNVIDSWTSDKNNQHDLPVSSFVKGQEYTLVETTAPYGYEMAESIVFKLDDNGDVLIKNSAGAFTPVSDNVVVMKDEPMYIAISKVDFTNKTELPGASLQITDGSGNVIDSWTSSNAVHKILVTKFNYDEEYVLTEKTAPKGYEIAENIIFKLERSGKVYVKSGDNWVVMADGVVVMEDKISTNSSTETTATTATTTSTETTDTTTTTSTETTDTTTATSTETTATVTTTENSGGLDDPSDGYGTPGNPDTPTTSTDTSTSTDTNIKTGDAAPIRIVFILMLMSGIGMLLLGTERKRKTR